MQARGASFFPAAKEKAPIEPESLADSTVENQPANHLKIFWPGGDRHWGFTETKASLWRLLNDSRPLLFHVDQESIDFRRVKGNRSPWD